MKFARLFVLGIITCTVQGVSTSRHSLWKPTVQEDTHRGIIIQALEAGLKGMEQFRNHFTEVLLRNVSAPMSDSDLALWVNALVAVGEDPRNQDGLNLVSDLARRVDAMTLPRPFLVLALCDAGSVNRTHLQKLLVYGNGRSANPTERKLEMMALTLKTLVCAFSHANSQNTDEFVGDMVQMASTLKFSMEDGQLGSIHCKSLMVQALTAYSIVDPSFQWNEKKALEDLRKESASSGLTKAYYISMALNARRVPFLKELHRRSHASTDLSVRRQIQVVLSLRNEEKEDADFSMTLRVPSGSNLFSIMVNAAEYSHRFKFSYTEDKNSVVFIIEVDNTFNDPEKGLYWIICSGTPERTNNFYATPSLFIPHDEEHIMLWYRSTDCPTL